MKLGQPNAQGQWEGGEGRRAYGWQRNGGHGEYILCDVETLIKLPDYLTYLDGAMIGKLRGSLCLERLTADPDDYIVACG